MKKTLIILLLVIVYQKSYSQSAQLTFLYDAAGNQISRIFIDSSNPQAKGGKTKTTQEEDFIKIFPNPTHGELKIEWSNNHLFSIEKITISDTQGNSWQQPFNNNNANSVIIDLINKEAGVYIISFQLSNNETIIRKIIKI